MNANEKIEKIIERWDERDSSIKVCIKMLNTITYKAKPTTDDMKTIKNVIKILEHS